ncbi:MAG: poly-gamma-glutamate synthase PgsB [Calditrichaeota bacterium]|nr:poly-gamma-glutamate synthase PgsB [Calditrichota bacterium]
MYILLLILVALCCYGAWEFRGHQVRLKRIPVRIHVNGSRGKSSVTRLIAAGLRAGGKRAVAKTTGTLPRIIDPLGREISIKRNQPANIIEQTKILRYIDKMFKPEILVIECMAVLPEYQWFCENKIVQSQIGVITNARLDHTNEMGKFREQIARSLSNTVPENGVLYTSEKTNLKVLKDIGKSKGTEVTRYGGQGITREELNRFSYIEHPANIGLSLAVCEKVGVDRNTALEGMYQATPDAGALRIAMCQEGSKEILFANAMAANDPESSLAIFNEIQERFNPLGKVILLLHSRSDRQDRSLQLIEMAAQHIEFDYLMLTGQSLKRFMGIVSKFKIPKSKTIGLGNVKPDKVYSEAFKLVEDRGTILGIGNVGAGGLDIARYFYKNRRL